MRRALLALLACAAVGAAEGDDVRDRFVRLDPSWYDPAHDDWRRVDLRAPPTFDLSDGKPRGGVGVEGIAWLLVALIAGGLAALAVQLWRSRVVEPGETPASRVEAARAVAVGELPMAAPAGGDPESALARALAQGDWSAATVWLYALMLLALDAAGVLRLARGKTNGAYRREAAGSPAGDDLAAGIDAFERAWFGRQPVDEPAVRALQAALARLRAHAARVDGGAPS